MLQCTTQSSKNFCEVKQCDGQSGKQNTSGAMSLIGNGCVRNDNARVWIRHSEVCPAMDHWVTDRLAFEDGNPLGEWGEGMKTSNAGMFKIPTTATDVRSPAEAERPPAAGSGRSPQACDWRPGGSLTEGGHYGCERQ
jgi:hypothetical protein